MLIYYVKVHRPVFADDWKINSAFVSIGIYSLNLHIVYFIYAYVHIYVLILINK